MSRKIYDYAKCYEIARQYTSASDFQKGNGSAYNVARKNKWLADYTWFVPKQHKAYTYEEVFEIAKHYTCSSDFQKGNGSAYGKARKEGWIKDYTWFVVKQHAPYTKEECYEVAKGYKSRVALAKGNVGVYQAALNHGWLDGYIWFDQLQKPNNYWTKDRVTEESRKYKSRGEFAIGSATAYGVARNNGWLDEFPWLKDERIDFNVDKVDCVYAYEFKEFNSVYVGRTLSKRAEERNKEHSINEKSTVFRFAREKNVPIPDMKILENGLTLAEGVEKEGTYVELYRQDGWVVLNRAKTGGIGLIARNKWTKKTCRDEALKYSSRSEFAEKNGSAYDVARREGWLDSYDWFEEKEKPVGYWDVYDNCYNAAKSCRNKSEFIKKYSRAYTKAKENGWLKDYTWFNIKRVNPNRKWFYDNVVEESKKYKTRKEFCIGSRGAYKVAVANGWIDSFDWFEDTRSVLSKAIKAAKKYKWTYEACKQLASECKGPKEFRDRSGGAYSAAWRNKWLADFFPKTK